MTKSRFPGTNIQDLTINTTFTFQGTRRHPFSGVTQGLSTSPKKHHLHFEEVLVTRYIEEFHQGMDSGTIIIRDD